jgi:glycosyltransferase involved in cell wall biosynthesis
MEISHAFKRLRIGFVSQMYIPIMDNEIKFTGKGIFEAYQLSQYSKKVVFIAFSSCNIPYKFVFNKMKFTLYLLPIEKIDTEAKPEKLVTLPITIIKNYLKTINYLCHILSYEKLDVVKIENILLIGFPAFIASALTRTPFILWIAGPELKVLNIKFQHFRVLQLISSLAFKIFSYAMIPNAKVLVNISPESEKIILKALPRVYVKLDSNYVNVQMFHPNPCLKEKNKKVILYVGRLEKEKGISLLLSAIEQISSKRNDFEVWIIGQGSLEEEIAKKIGEKLLPIKLLGEKDIRELPFFYNCADIFLLPSLVEGPSAALMEAMSCGVAVISTTGPIDHLQNGLLVRKDSAAIAEAINILLEDEDLRRKIAKNASKYVRLLSKRYMETMRNIYLFSASK